MEEVTRVGPIEPNYTPRTKTINNYPWDELEPGDSVKYYYSSASERFRIIQRLRGAVRNRNMKEAYEGTGKKFGIDTSNAGYIVLYRLKNPIRGY